MAAQANNFFPGRESTGRSGFIKYLKYGVDIIISPQRAVLNLVDDPQRFKVGLFCVLALGVLYAITAFRLYTVGIPATTPPFLKLPADSYYLYEVFFVIPVDLAGWLLMGSTIFLLHSQSKRDYKDVLAVLGLPYAILVFPLMWLPETVVAFGWPQIWMSDWWQFMTPIRSALGTIWVYIGCVLAVKELYGSSWLRSLPIAFAGLIVGLGTCMIFIR